MPVAYTCLFANYNEYGTKVWYVGDPRGIMTIPAITDLCASLNGRFLGPGAAGVQDSGVTAILLGSNPWYARICRHFALGLGAKAERISKLSEIPTFSMARNIQRSCLLAIVCDRRTKNKSEYFTICPINGVQFDEILCHHKHLSCWNLGYH